MSVDDRQRRRESRPRRGLGSPRYLADEIADTIWSWIATGELASGEKLPSERELVARLGVSRPALREAISSLEALAIIESRTTRGRYVADRGDDRRSEQLAAAWIRQHADPELDELRGVLEAHVVSSMSESDAFDAARRARPLIFDQEKAIELRLPAHAVECDSDFHKLLCSYTANRALSSLAEGLIESTRAETRAVYSLSETNRRAIEQHWRIIEALAAGDVAHAARLDADHLLDTVRRYEIVRAQAKRDSLTETAAGGQPDPGSGAGPTPERSKE